MSVAASNSTACIVGAVGAVGLIFLLIAEGRRADRRHRAARWGATTMAVVALGLLALRPIRMTYPREGLGTAVLWTAGEEAMSAPAGERFALPGARVNEAVTRVPDAGTWRRRFPAFDHVHLAGGGLEAAELPALEGMQVDFTPGTTLPGLISLRCPRRLALGEGLAIEGRAGGLTPGSVATISLEGPDGQAIESALPPADANGQAGFTLRASAPAAAGNFDWRLRLRVGDGSATRLLTEETIGIAVRTPELPRVLVLESTPRFDTARLRRWYEEAGGTLRERLRVGQDRYRYFTAEGASAGEFNSLDAALLAGFDAVLADGRALLSLPAGERSVLGAAIAEGGLGVVLLADDAILPPATIAPDRAWLFPWQLRVIEGASDQPGNNERLARLTWPGHAESDIPLPAASFEIVPKPGQATLLRDDQGRVLAASASIGRGALALTLARESARWERANEPGVFAEYWAWLFSRIARPRDAVAQPVIEGGDNGAVFVDRPLELIWSAKDAPGVATIREPALPENRAPAPTMLVATKAPQEPTRWRSTFWPRRAGWHHLEAGGGTLDFWVDRTGSWPALAAWRRRTATERWVARPTGTPLRARMPVPAEIPPGWWFGAFLVAASYLWIERRFSST